MTSFPLMLLLVEHARGVAQAVYAGLLVAFGFVVVLRNRPGADADWPWEFLFTPERRPSPRCRAERRSHPCVLADREEAQP
ncbi:MAG TPA: hypothetical protein VGW74_07035 [Propionibacteriaceae bacterium]|nr:hypothetical protein [Propionibacteriaceae bacterium]